MRLKIIYLIPILFLCLICNIAFAQTSKTILYPAYNSKNNNTPDITKIEITDKYTIIHFSYKTPQNYCIPETFFLMDSKSRIRFSFVKAENISICKDNSKTGNYTKNFVLYFNKLTEQTTLFDFVDPKITGKYWLDWNITEISMFKSEMPVVIPDFFDKPTVSEEELKKEKDKIAIYTRDKMIDVLSRDTLQSTDKQYKIIDSTFNLLKKMGYEKLPNVDYDLVNSKNDEIKTILNKKNKSVTDSSNFYMNMIIVKNELFKGLKTTLEELKSQPQNAENVEKINSIQNIIIILSKETDLIKSELARLNSLVQEQEYKIRQKNMLLTGLILLLILLAVLAFVLYKQYNAKKKTNKILTENNILINKQKEEISEQYQQIRSINTELEKKHRNITDSIQAAKRIQDALIPEEIDVLRLFRDSFILNKPKNIVSGDFYWMKQINNKIVIAIADCTGHGVPGAFMSMLGVSLLNELVVNDTINAAGILNNLRHKVKSTLNQTNILLEAEEGMDMALCVINLSELTCEFAGANNPLYLIRNGEIIEYEPDRQPIAAFIREKEFTNICFNLLPNDQLYMFSDGYIDQLGEKTKRKYKSSSFKDLLLRIDKLSFLDKKLELYKEFENWRGLNNQTDDVLVFGVLI